MTDEWHEDEQYWIEFQDFMFSEGRMEKAEGQVEKLLELLELGGDEKILDLPCGVGRHSKEFAEKGFEVTGVDVTEAYVEEARERYDAEFEQGDMRDYSPGETFDVILNLFTSFGYFESREDDRRTAENFFDLLKDGGKLVIDTVGKELAASDFNAKGWSEHENGLFLQEMEIQDNFSWMHNRWIAVKNGEKKEYELSFRLYSAYEMKELLNDAGFSEVKVYGSLDGGNYDQNAERLVVVAEK